LESAFTRGGQLQGSMLFILVALLLLAAWGDEQEPRCGSGDPCVFMDKDTGWVLWRKPEWTERPYPPRSDSWKRPESTIYLSIASFRDKLCPLTLYNVFTKAKHPARIFPGVVQQNVLDEGVDLDCLDTYCMLVEDFGFGNATSTTALLDAVTAPQSAYKSGRRPRSTAQCPFYANVRMDRVNARTAMGPTWARARGSAMLRDEEFCMQTDAHMDFVEHWDVKMMSMWGATNNEYAVLSTYVAPTEQLKFNVGNGAKGLNALHEVPHLCMVTLYGSHDLPRIWGTKCARSLPEPKLTNGIWGAGLSFSKCHAERKSPYDPHTPQIFDGEEFSRSVRFWTWGYDIYTPHRVNVVHNYHVSQSDPTHFDWARNAVGTGETSAVRIKTMIGAPGGEANEKTAAAVVQSRYGLGDRRTLDQYIAFSGIDTKKRKILGNRCGNIDFVPFREHPLGPEYVPAFDAQTEAPLDPRDPGSVYFDGSAERSKAWEAFLTERRRSLAQQAQQQVRAKSAAVAAFGATITAPKSASFSSSSSSSAAAGGGGGASLLKLTAQSHLSKSDEALLGFTVFGIVALALYAACCRRHFTEVFLGLGKGKGGPSKRT